MIFGFALYTPMPYGEFFAAMGNRFLRIKNQQVTRYGEFFGTMGNAMGSDAFKMFSVAYADFQVEIPHSGQKKILGVYPLFLKGEKSSPKDHFCLFGPSNRTKG